MSFDKFPPYFSLKQTPLIHVAPSDPMLTLHTRSVFENELNDVC